jgi:hypothetical protein
MGRDSTLYISILRFQLFSTHQGTRFLSPFSYANGASLDRRRRMYCISPDRNASEIHSQSTKHRTPKIASERGTSLGSYRLLNGSNGLGSGVGGALLRFPFGIGSELFTRREVEALAKPHRATTTSRSVSMGSPQPVIDARRRW